MALFASSTDLYYTSAGLTRILLESFSYMGRRQLVAPDGVLVELSGGKYELLLALLRRPHIALTRDQPPDMTRGGEARLKTRAGWFAEQPDQLRR